MNFSCRCLLAWPVREDASFFPIWLHVKWIGNMLWRRPVDFVILLRCFTWSDASYRRCHRALGPRKKHAAGKIWFLLLSISMGILCLTFTDSCDVECWMWCWTNVSASKVKSSEIQEMISWLWMLTRRNPTRGFVFFTFGSDMIRWWQWMDSTRKYMVIVCYDFFFAQQGWTQLKYVSTLPWKTALRGLTCYHSFRIQLGLHTWVWEE